MRASHFATLVTYFAVMTVAQPLSPGVTATMFYSYASTTLLSGGTNDCPTATASTCVGGLAGALALIRNFTSFGEVHTFVPFFDYQTAFVQMHPLKWGVNTVIFDGLNVPYVTCRPSLFFKRPDSLGIVNGTVSPFTANAVIGATTTMQGFNKPYMIDPNTGFGYLRVFDSAQAAASEPIAATVAYLPVVRQKAPTVVVIYEDGDVGNSPMFIAGLAAAAAQAGLSMPDLVIDVLTDRAPQRVNGTWLVGAVSSATALASIPITVSVPAAGGPHTFVRVSTPRSTSLTIPSSLKTATYVAQQAFLRTQALAASVNDPVLATSNIAMPFTRVSVYRMCMAGECPIGNFWTDGMRYTYGDDISFTTSGGLRGPGWPAGPIRVSDLWASLPFSNNFCRASMTGVTLFEIFNASVSLATFQGVSTTFGDRLLQSSGMRYGYNTNSTPKTLVYMDVLNRKTGEWEPIDRLKLYAVVTDSFTCTGFPPFSTFIQRRQYPGETYTLLDAVVQSAQEQFLRDLGNYTPGVFGRQRNITNATTPMNLVQTQRGCVADTYWDAKWYTCRACPAGMQQPQPQQTSCIAIVPVDNTGTTVVAIVVPVLAAIILVVIGQGVYRTVQANKLLRNVDYAPKSGRVSIMFTDIEASTKLWSTAPQCMSQALDHHHQVIRLAINQYRGYEVKTAGDSFMIAFSTEDDAVGAAMQIQRGMFEHKYPAAINQVYIAANEDELLEIGDEPSDLSDAGSALWNGLRVRIGVHSGEPSVVFDEVAKGYDYYGPPVNVAARTEAAASGGQVCLTSFAAGYVTMTEGIDRRDIGPFALKGVADPVTMFQFLPNEFRDRKFGSGDGDEKVARLQNEPSDGSVMQSDEDAELVNGDLLAFARTMFRIIPPRDRSKQIHAIAQAWRVVTVNADDDKITDALASRVEKAMAKEKRRLERMQANNRLALGNSLSSQRNGGGSMGSVHGAAVSLSPSAQPLPGAKYAVAQMPASVMLDSTDDLILPTASGGWEHKVSPNASIEQRK